MVNQNKIFSFKIKRQAKNIFPRDVERTVHEQVFFLLVLFLDYLNVVPILFTCIIYIIFVSSCYISW